MLRLQKTMNNMKHLIFLAVVLLCSVVFAQEAPCASQPASVPESQPEVTPQTRAILEKLEAAGEKFAVIRGDIEYKVVNTTLGDSEIRQGWVCLRRERNEIPDKKTQSAFRVHFETLQQASGPKRQNRVDYAYDGQWLNVAKESTKTVTRYQISEKADNADSMSLGKGPFPIPFGQKADDMIRYFECTTREPNKFDPPDSDYLKLVPRKEYKDDFSFTYAQIWVSRNTYLPARIVSMDTSQNRTAVAFSNVTTPGEIESDMFRINKPAGWKLIVKRLESGDSLAP